MTRKQLLALGFGRRSIQHSLLDKLFFQLSDSDLEIHFRCIVRAAKLSMPLSKQRINDFEVDFFWPELGLVVETDVFVTTARRHLRPATPAATVPT